LEVFRLIQVKWAANLTLNSVAEKMCWNNSKCKANLSSISAIAEISAAMTPLSCSFSLFYG
jgi:hypothetical protein